MKGILANFDREFRAYFFSPLAYIVAALVLLINGVVFWLIVSYLNDPRAAVGAPLQLFFGQTFFFWLVIVFVAAVLTMRLLSEERRSGTICRAGVSLNRARLRITDSSLTIDDIVRRVDQLPWLGR